MMIRSCPWYYSFTPNSKTLHVRRSLPRRHTRAGRGPRTSERSWTSICTGVKPSDRGMGVRDTEEGSRAVGGGWGPVWGAQGRGVESGRVRIEGLESEGLISLWFRYEGMEMMERTFNHEGEE